MQKKQDFKKYNIYNNNTDININIGLTKDQVKTRKEKGLFNYNVKPKFKTTGQILVSNIFTYFNILNFVLAIFVLAVGEIKNVFFIGVVICNIFIGIAQEIKVRSIIKKLSIVSQPKAIVIRDGNQEEIDISEIVLDDIIILNSGNQIVADAIVKDGFVEVNESLITGESDLVLKKQGDKLISGSFVVSGSCKACVQSVGEKTYVSKILTDVGQYKNTKNKSEIMKYINTVVKIVAVVIIPVGVLRFYKEYFWLHNNIKDSVVFTVASVIGMIPEGIILLTSVTLMIGVIRLIKLNTLTQDLFCLETLAKVDVLCLDKTGTLTQGEIEVDEIIKINNNNLINIELMLYNFCLSTKDIGSTVEGLKKYINKNIDNKKNWDVQDLVCFSSDRKWSGINFKNNINLVLGAPEILLNNNINKYNYLINKYIDQGKRILVLGVSDKKLDINILPEIDPVAFIIMSDKVRDKAFETIDFFKKQGVKIKIISGDNAASVSRIARLVRVEESEKYIDSSSLKSNEDIKKAIKNYNIFGRTKPEQKREIIKAYQEAGHVVGMIGDGVNDILALKQADCSIAMSEGSDAARQISKFVLLDSDFKSVPNIVNEGRRVINNIIRSASMFLIKNIYSFALSLILLFFASSYPFQPIQLTLLGTLTVGLPSFFLVLENNKEPIKKNFFKIVLRNALPPSVAIIFNILLINIINKYLINLDSIEISTMAVILTGLCNLLALIKISKPINFKRRLIIIVFLAIFLFSIIFFKNIFLLCNINIKILIIILILGLLSFWGINYF